MTFAKASALIVALAGAYALGVWTGPVVRDAPDTVAIESEPRPAAPVAEPAPVKTAPSRGSKARLELRVPATAKPVQMHVRTLLNRGAVVESASAGFEDAEQLLTVAYAARNTGIPFLLLKDRVLAKGRSVSDAIEASKPEVNARLEADRARAEARADLARLSS
jgi:hypothetical protein